MTELNQCPEPSEADYSNTLDSVRDYVYYLECKIISLEKRHTPDVDALVKALTSIMNAERYEYKATLQSIATEALKNYKEKTK